MSEKIIGYTLLFLGLLIMIFAAINLYMVFTNKVKPFGAFNIKSSSNSGAGSLDVSALVKQLQSENPDVPSQPVVQPKIDILPPEVLNQSLNLTIHFIFMSFIASFGYKLASLGVQLVRPIKVKLKSDAPKPPPQSILSSPPPAS